MKILGYEVPIKKFTDKESTEDGKLYMGNYNGFLNEIKLNKHLKGDMKHETKFHEVLEAINGLLELKLKHTQLCSISTVLYSIMKDNGFDLREWK